MRFHESTMHCNSLNCPRLTLCHVELGEFECKRLTVNAMVPTMVLGVNWGVCVCIEAEITSSTAK